MWLTRPTFLRFFEGSNNARSLYSFPNFRCFVFYNHLHYVLLDQILSSKSISQILLTISHLIWSGPKYCIRTEVLVWLEFYIILFLIFLTIPLIWIMISIYSNACLLRWAVFLLPRAYCYLHLFAPKYIKCLTLSNI